MVTLSYDEHSCEAILVWVLCNPLQGEFSTDTNHKTTIGTNPDVHSWWLGEDECRGNPDRLVSGMTAVSQSEVLGRFYNPNTTPKDKERVVVYLCGTGQELH